MIAAFAAHTLRRSAMAPNVTRIMPVAYSDVIERIARAPKIRAAKSTPISAELVGSKSARCLTLMSAHWLTVVETLIKAKPIETATAVPMAIQVERRVRSLVHSARKLRTSASPPLGMMSMADPSIVWRTAGMAAGAGGVGGGVAVDVVVRADVGRTVDVIISSSCACERRGGGAVLGGFVGELEERLLERW